MSEVEFEPKIIAFCCNWCSYTGADLAGVSRLQYPPNVRIIRVMCSGMVHPNLVIDQSISLVEKLPQFRDVNIEVEKSASLPSILGDPHQLQQVILNFLMNSTEAMKGKGTIKLSTEYEHRYDKCHIIVEDNGPGIPENLIDKIFEPFFSTKGTNGLGLAVSWGIIERHHGKIEVEMSESGGALFRIALPAYHEGKHL